MPWEAVAPSSGSWAAQVNERTYAASYYADDDYVEDEEWTLSSDPAGDWEIAA